MMEIAVSIIVAVIVASTPLVLAAIGELVVERAGVLNLGVEGMMLVGAVVAFVGVQETGSVYLGIVFGLVAGMAMALVFGIMTLTLLANQVATGLALTIFGIGVSALAGTAYVGDPKVDKLQLDISGLSDIPVIGPILFSHHFLIYLGIAMVPAVWWFLTRTKAGLALRAVGESHDAAHAIGYPVIGIRYGAVLFGGAMAGLAGATLAIEYGWKEELSAGRGWIALALVVFATWRPWRVLLGAYLFGIMRMLELHGQSLLDWDMPSQIFSMLPYLATIIVLVVISRDALKVRLNAPACLGQPFHPTV